MADDYKRLPPKLEGEELNHGNPWVIYCHSCKWRDTEHCGKCKDVFVQGAYPWDCIFCSSNEGKYRTFDLCPLRRAADCGEMYKGCPKLCEGGKSGEFCNSAVRSICVRRKDDEFARFCDHYDFDPYAADSECLQLRTYSYGMNYAVVRRVVNARQWLTVADMLDNISFEDLQKAAKRGDTSVKSVWMLLCECADTFGWTCDETCFRRLSYAAQMRHVRCVCAYDEYRKRESQVAASEERKAKKRKNESEASK